MLFKKKETLIIAFSFMIVVFYGIEVCYTAAAMMIATIILYKRRYSISYKRFPGRWYYFALVVLGLAIGLPYVFMGKYTPRNYLKHCIYVTFPYLFFLVGFNTIKLRENTNSRAVLRALFYCGVFYSIYDLVKIFISFLTHQANMGSLYNLRASIGTGEQYAVYTLFLGICFKDEIGKVKHRKIINAILAIEIIIHFSRLNILLTAIFAFYLVKEGIKRRYIYNIFAILIVILTIMTVFPNMGNELMGKILNSSREISIRQNEWNYEEVITNWRGYEAYCETVKFNNASIIEKMFGGGFGSLLDVGEYAHLVSTEDYLPYLHNGFFTILMIWGIVGELLYFFMLMSMYKAFSFEAVRQTNYAKCMVITLTIFTLLVHGPLFSVSGGFIFLYIGILCGVNNTNQTIELIAKGEV